MSRKRASVVADVQGSVETSGPLGPWRLSIAVGVATLTTGLPLADALGNGTRIDQSLGRSFGVAFLVWVVLGAINRVLAQVEVDRAVDERTAADAPRDWTENDRPGTPISGTAA